MSTYSGVHAKHRSLIPTVHEAQASYTPSLDTRGTACSLLEKEDCIGLWWDFFAQIPVPCVSLNPSFAWQQAPVVLVRILHVSYGTNFIRACGCTAG